MNCKKKLKAARRLLKEDLSLTQGEIGGKLQLERKELLRVLMELCDEELYQFENPLKKRKAQLNEKMQAKIANYCDEATKILQDNNYDINNYEIVANCLRLIEEILYSVSDKKQSENHFHYGNVISNLIFEINNIAIFKMVYNKHQKEFFHYLHDPENYCELLEKFFDQIRANADEEYLMNVARMLGLIANEVSSKKIEEVINTYHSQLKAKKNNRGCRKELKRYLGIIKKSVYNNNNINPETLRYLSSYYGINREFSCDIEEAMRRDDETQYVDLRQKHVVTIDGTKVGCLEDAISIEAKPNGNYCFILYVVDPHAYIKEQSQVLKEAKQRGESVYARGSVIPMLPDELSYDRLSLLKGEVKKVIATEYEFSPQFDLISFSSYKALINVYENYNFNEINNMNDKKTETFIMRLHELKNSLQKEYSAVNNLHSEKNSVLFADELISYIKIFGNHTMTEKYMQTDLPFIYCVDDGVNKIVNELQNKNPFLQLEKEAKKGKTYYSIDNNGHSSLNLNCYARVTTPVRNFVALKNQNLYRKVIIEGKQYNDQEIYLLEDELRDITTHMNKKQENIQAFVEENNYCYPKVKKLGYLD